MYCGQNKHILRFEVETHVTDTHTHARHDMFCMGWRSILTRLTRDLATSGLSECVLTLTWINNLKNPITLHPSSCVSWLIISDQQIPAKQCCLTWFTLQPLLPKWAMVLQPKEEVQASQAVRSLLGQPTIIHRCITRSRDHKAEFNTSPRKDPLSQIRSNHTKGFLPTHFGDDPKTFSLPGYFTNAGEAAKTLSEGHGFTVS
jgi:hypothetical protein